MIIANWKANGGFTSNIAWHKELTQIFSNDEFLDIGIAPSHIHFTQIVFSTGRRAALVVDRVGEIMRGTGCNGFTSEIHKFFGSGGESGIVFPSWVPSPPVSLQRRRCDVRHRRIGPTNSRPSCWAATDMPQCVLAGDEDLGRDCDVDVAPIVAMRMAVRRRHRDGSSLAA